MNGIRKNKADPNMPKRRSLADQMRERKEARVVVSSSSSSSSESEQSLKIKKSIENCSKAESQESNPNEDFNFKQDARKSKIDSDFERKQVLYEYRKKQTEMMRAKNNTKYQWIGFYAFVFIFWVVCPMILVNESKARKNNLPEECEWNCAERCDEETLTQQNTTQTECIGNCEFTKEQNLLMLTTEEYYEEDYTNEEKIWRLCDPSSGINHMSFEDLAFTAFSITALVICQCVFYHSLANKDKEILQKAIEQAKEYGETLDEEVA